MLKSSQMSIHKAGLEPRTLLTAPKVLTDIRRKWRRRRRRREEKKRRKEKEKEKEEDEKEEEEKVKKVEEKKTFLVKKKWNEVDYNTKKCCTGLPKLLPSKPMLPSISYFCSFPPSFPSSPTLPLLSLLFFPLLPFFTSSLSLSKQTNKQKTNNYNSKKAERTSISLRLF